MRWGLALLVALALGCGAPASKCGPATATVARAIDGDTLELTDGTRVRYLLVDAPETTKGKNDCYGAEAAAFNAGKVEGKTVSLAYDEAGCVDRFGRTLAYVSVDGVEVNRALAEQGLACVLFVAPSGAARRMEFDTYESIAKTNRTGLWGACSVVTCE